ncbi:MAG: AAA family ATPase [Ruminococcus sp.]|jgi:cytidylate kinase
MKSLAIERQFGSGGREIGKKVAQQAGIPYYDGELMVKAARSRGISLDLLKEYDEQKTGSILYNIALFANYNQDSRQKKIYALFSELQRTIRELEMQGPAVFIGRCSTEIFHDNPRVVKGYIYSSDREKRLKRIMDTEEVGSREAERLMDKKDRQRREYFKFWTGKKWEDRNNYDLELNTSVLSPEKCADLLIEAMK